MFAIRVLGALLLALPQLSVQAQSQISRLTYTVRGSVVNSETGEPVRNALVQLNAAVQKAQLSGSDGSFAFENVPSGAANIEVQKPGYFSSQNSPWLRIQAGMITVGPSQPDAILKLIPEAIISGRITGDNGEPVESLTVQLLRERIEDGKKDLWPAGSVNTDEEGEYRFAELESGKYFLIFGPGSTAAVFPAKFSQSGARGYGVIFYPGARELADASPLEIPAGKHLEINFAMELQSFYRITGALRGFPVGEQANLQFLNAAGQTVSNNVELDPESGAFRTSWIPSGPVTIKAMTMGPPTTPVYSASRALNLSSDLSDVRLTLAPTATIQVYESLERSRNLESSTSQDSLHSGPTHILAQALLISTGPPGLRRQYASETTAEDNQVQVFRNVEPGRYFLQVSPNGQYYVHSARSGSTDLLEENLTVSSGSSVRPIEIVLRDDGASVQGKISFKDSNAFASVMALPLSNLRNVSVISATSEGTFQFMNLAPGRYRFLAVDRPDVLEYRNPDALQKYLSRSREISVAPNDSAKIELELMQIIEPGQ